VIGAYHDASEQAAGARCCNDDGTSCSTPGSCPAQLTFAQASKLCTDEGKRLCTKSELLSDICCGTGGNCDSYAVWTSSSDQATPSTSAMPGGGDFNGELD
jgi:hypothetical protein